MAALIAVSGLGVAGLGVWQLSQSQPTGTRPGANVLLITLDTTRADYLGCYGHPAKHTPHIDRLAAEGTRFAQCVSAVPSTLPSHATILSGTYPYVHGARHNVGYRLSEPNTTITEAVQSAGYQTAAYIGAMVLASDTGLDQGFDVYDDVGRRHERRADEVCDGAIEWLRGHAAGRFFLWVHLFDPHFPYDPPEPFRTRFGDRYVGEIAYVDQQVGRLLDELKRLDRADSTLVVLTSDHGEGLGQHGEETHLYYVYDTTLSVPLILRCPAHIPAGRVMRGQVRTIDIAPTILAFLGVAPERGLPAAQGTSLIPSLLDGTGGGDLPAYAESLSAHLVLDVSPLRCLRADGWKYIAAPRGELYDIRNDPGEEHNLATIDARRTEAMHDQLRAIVAASPAPVRADDRTVRLDPETLDRLAALGYVAGTSETPAWADSPEEDVEPLGADPKDHGADLAAVGQAVQHLQDGEFRRAETLYRRLVEKFPGRPGLSVQLARSVLLQGKDAEAIEIYRELLTAHPDQAEAHYGLGKLFERTGQRSEAIEHFAAAVRIDPELAEAYYDMGVALRKQGRNDLATAYFREALKVRPTYVDARVNLGVELAAMGRLDDAIEQYRRALRVAPNDADIHYNLGNALLRKGDRSEAIGAYREALRLHPDFPAAQQAVQAVEGPMGAGSP